MSEILADEKSARADAQRSSEISGASVRPSALVMASRRSPWRSSDLAAHPHAQAGRPVKVEHVGYEPPVGLRQAGAVDLATNRSQDQPDLGKRASAGFGIVAGRR
jgi:hypothetical protein